MSHELSPESDQPALSAESQEAFLRLMKGAQPVLLRYVMSLVGNRGDAEDVLQRASVSMWRRFETFDPDSALEAAGSAPVARTGDVFKLGDNKVAMRRFDRDCRY